MQMISLIFDVAIVVLLIAVAYDNLRTRKKLKALRTIIQEEFAPAMDQFTDAISATEKNLREIDTRADTVVERISSAVQNAETSQHSDPTPKQFPKRPSKRKPTGRDALTRDFYHLAQSNQETA